jgi:prolipoprotein diacylglyceryl transferase
VNIAAIPSPTESVWHVFGFPIRAYALCIITGMVAATLLMEQRLRHRGAAPWVSLDVVVWAVPFGIIGARIYHVISSPADYFGANGNPVKAFFIWEGGLGIWGAVAGGAVGAWIAARQIGIPLSVLADSLAPALPVAQAIGRLGNWFNNELFGGVTTLPWGLEVHEMDASNPGHAVMIDGEPVTRPDLYHPAFLYELIWNLGVAALVWLLDRKFKFGRGRAFALYVMAYTAGRLWIEMLREDTATHFFGIRLNVYTSIIVFLGAAIYFFVVKGPRGYVVPIDAPDTVTGPVAGEDSDVSQVDVTAVGKSSEHKPPIAYRLVTEEQFVEYRKSGVLPPADEVDEADEAEAPEAVAATVGDSDKPVDKPADES